MTSANGGPAKPEPARKLEALLGVWVVAGTMTTGDGPARISGRWQFSPAAGGSGVRTVGQTSIEGLGTFEEEELIGFDPGDGAVHMFSLNKLAVRDHVGAWKDDRTLVVEYRGIQGGKHCRERITIAIDGDRMEATVVETLDGEVVVTTSLSLARER